MIISLNQTYFILCIPHLQQPEAPPTLSTSFPFTLSSSLISHHDWFYKLSYKSYKLVKETRLIVYLVQHIFNHRLNISFSGNALPGPPCSLTACSSSTTCLFILTFVHSEFYLFLFSPLLLFLYFTFSQTCSLACDVHQLRYHSLVYFYTPVPGKTEPDAP